MSCRVESLSLLVSLLPAGAFFVCGTLHASEAPSSSTTLTDSAELQTWMDPFVERQMRESHIPGAIVCVVKDGRIFFSKGYGWSDIAARRPVDASKTLFRIASVTKLFTATAIMQQVERGTLRLDTDVRGIVDFPMRLTSSKALQISDLLTHRGGFENGLFGVLSSHMTELPSLKEVLSRTMPTQVRDPGTLSAYSNHSFTLLAYVIERTTGMPMARYLKENVFEPLGMRSTSFLQPLPAPLRDQVATGYSYADGQLTPHPFEIVLAAGGGAISATADDMGRFMLAQLQLGALGDARILSAATARAMHAVHFSYAPGPGGMGLGFPHATINGHDILWHTGSLYFCYSRLVLIPDSGVGIFIAGNSDNADDLQEHLFTSFMNRYFPEPAATTLPSATTAASAENATEGVAGEYRPSGEPMTTFAALKSLADMAIVHGTPQGLSILRRGQLLNYARVAPMRYRTRDADAMTLGDLVFFRASSGEIAGYAVQNRETSSMESVTNPLRTRAVTLVLLRIVYVFETLGLLAAGALAWRWKRHALLTQWAITLTALTGLGAWTLYALHPWLARLVADEMDWVPQKLVIYLTGTSGLAVVAGIALVFVMRIAILARTPAAWRVAAALWSAATLLGISLIGFWHLFGYHYY